MLRRTTIFLVLAFVVLTGCSEKAAAQQETGFNTPLSNQVEPHQESGQGDHDHVDLDPDQVTAEMTVVLVASELVVGPNRFAVGLFDEAGNMVQDAEVQFHFYDLTNPETPTLESHGAATRLQSDNGLTTIFAQEREFTRAGAWGVEVQARFPDNTAAIKRVGFEVLSDSPTLKSGDKVPAIVTPRLSDVANDLGKLTTAPEPNPALHEMDLAQAIASGKPTVFLLAAPAFCQTRFCGPAYDIVSELQHKYADAANFVDVEVYTGIPDPTANDWELSPAMTAFGLSTEPWLYLIDSGGTVVYRVEGLFTSEEVERHLQPLLN